MAMQNRKSSMMPVRQTEKSRAKSPMSDKRDYRQLVRQTATLVHSKSSSSFDSGRRSHLEKKSLSRSNKAR